MSRILQFLFGCGCKNTSRVFTINGRSYVVCLDCGKEIDYSLTEMRAA